MIFAGIYFAQYAVEGGAPPAPTIDLPNVGVVVIVGGRVYPWNYPNR